MKKRRLQKKSYLSIMVACVVILLLSACSNNGNTQGSNATANTSTDNKGTIIWLSNLSSGTQYDGTINYTKALSEELGYKVKVVYGDMYNDPAGNLTAVRNGMTNDVVAIIASQDGGMKDIMQEYPELYVAGYNTDMRSVFVEGGSNQEVLNNEKFLGTIADGFTNGALLGQQYANAVIEKGYKKVSVVIFPEYAYPNLNEANLAFRAAIEEYNSSAADADKIEIVGDTKVLEFAPLESSYFLEAGNNELDAIVGFLAGTDFLYPTMKSAIQNGTANSNMKLLTAGFNTDSEIVADIGGEGVIQFLSISPGENVAWPIIMIDNALHGKVYSDFTKAEAIDSLPYEIASKEDIDNVITKGLTGTADASLAQISIDEIKQVMTRYNENATYSELKELFQSDKLSVAELKNR